MYSELLCIFAKLPLLPRFVAKHLGFKSTLKVKIIATDDKIWKGPTLQYITTSVINVRVIISGFRCHNFWNLNQQLWRDNDSGVLFRKDKVREKCKINHFQPWHLFEFCATIEDSDSVFCSNCKTTNIALCCRKMGEKEKELHSHVQPHFHFHTLTFTLSHFHTFTFTLGKWEKKRKSYTCMSSQRPDWHTASHNELHYTASNSQYVYKSVQI